LQAFLLKLSAQDKTFSYRRQIARKLHTHVEGI